MNVVLMAKFTKEEMAQMFPTKAPGPNDFPTMFYQKYWDVVGNKTTFDCLEVLNNLKLKCDRLE